MANTDEERLAEKAQDGARGQYAKAAKGAIAAGLDAHYTAQPGDTFESIAKAVYGDEAHAASIFDASLTSGAVSSDRKAVIPGGTVLTLPVVAAEGQPSAGDDRDVATEVAGDRPTGDRPVAVGGAAREGGVGDPSARPARSRSAAARRPSSTSRRKR